MAMGTVTQTTLTCDVCGNAKDVRTWAFELDGQAYEIDLCRKDSNALNRVTAGYIAKARKVTAKPGQRRRGGKPRSRPANAARGTGPRRELPVPRRRPRPAAGNRGTRRAPRLRQPGAPTCGSSRKVSTSTGSFPRISRWQPA